MTTYFLELRQNGGTPEGTEIADWAGTLNPDDHEWLAANGYGTSNPDLWLNVVEGGTWAPDNDLGLVAQREITRA